jgi:exonuclease SbcD
MKRIAIIADSHFSEASRFAECIRIHDWIADELEREGCDMVLLSGDIYDRASSPIERQAVAAWLTRIAEVAPVVGVRGNHDALHDIALLGRLRTHYPITIEEACGVHVVAGVAVACLAWPRKGELLAHAPGVSGSEALRAVLNGLGRELAEHIGPKVLLAHAMVRGSVTSSGQPLVGCDLELGLEDLGLASADLVALGHIHVHQHWEWNGAPVIYPGSPRRTAFGESEAKGYVVAHLESGRPAEWLFRETPATPMVDAEVTWHGPGSYDVAPSGGCEDLGDWGLYQKAEVRVRYEVPSDQRDAARADMEKLAAELRETWGAAHVQVEEQVRATVTARAPEVAAAKTTADKVQALWKVRGFDPGDRRERLLGKLTEIEGGAA